MKLVFLLTAVVVAYFSFATSSPLFAQDADSPSSPVTSSRELTDEEAAQAMAGCAACGGGMLIVAIVAIVLNIALLIWVARDAKSRGMDSSVLWMILVFFTGIIGLIIYIFSRPQGQLTQCSHCGNKRLSASAKCPHCGNS
jgi:small-conductance mechanosensitive channel